MSRMVDPSSKALRLVEAFLSDQGQIPPCTSRQREAAVTALCTLADQTWLGQPPNDAMGVAQTTYRAQTGADAPAWLEWLLAAFSMSLEQQASR